MRRFYGEIAKCCRGSYGGIDIAELHADIGTSVRATFHAAYSPDAKIMPLLGTIFKHAIPTREYSTFLRCHVASLAKSGTRDL